MEMKKSEIRMLIDEMVAIDDKIQKLENISPIQKRKLKSSFASTLRAINKIDTYLHKQVYKGKPLNDDSQLLNLVLHNNSVELGKKLS